MDARVTVDVAGIAVPAIFYGTAWKEDDTERCVYEALKAGFRAIDTANQRKHYHEAAVGAALRRACGEGIVGREALFIQTKFTHVGGQDHRLPYDARADIVTQVRQSFASSREHLGTDRLDSYVLHGPSVRHGLAAEDVAAWRAMEQLVQDKSVRLLGVSNVSAEQLQLLLGECSVKPSFVQNRCYARRGWDREVRAICRTHGIVYQGFSLLTANSDVLQAPQFRTAVEHARCSPAQLIFAFALQVGMIPLTGTTDPNHMREDLAACALRLSDETVQTIETLLV